MVTAMVLFPGLIADAEKTSSLSGGCDLSNSLLPPSKEYWFGTDQQGCDVFALSRLRCATQRDGGRDRALW